MQAWLGEEEVQKHAQLNTAVGGTCHKVVMGTT